jgi:hypothetical protein
MGINNPKNYDEKRIANRVILLFFMITLFTVVIFYKSINDASSKSGKIEVGNAEYFNNFNESFKGVIIDKKNTMQSVGENKLCLLKIKLSESSVKYYDPRDSLRLYFCVMNYPYAEVFIHEYYYHQIDIGDSCLFNGKTDKYCIGFKNQNEIFWDCEKPNINRNIYFFEELHTIGPIEIPNNYYMLLFGKFRKKEKLAKTYKKLSDKRKSNFYTIPKYFEKRHGFYYFFPE